MNVFISFLWLRVHNEGKSGQEFRAGTWSQELKKPWRNTTNWLILCLASLLSSITQDQLHMSSIVHRGPGPSRINY